MAQDESGIPVGKDNTRRSADLLPRYYRTVANKKFLTSTLDQLVQPGAIEKVDGFVGRKDSKAEGGKGSKNIERDALQNPVDEQQLYFIK